MRPRPFVMNSIWLVRLIINWKRFKEELKRLRDKSINRGNISRFSRMKLFKIIINPRKRRKRLLNRKQLRSLKDLTKNSPRSSHNLNLRKSRFWKKLWRRFKQFYSKIMSLHQRSLRILLRKKPASRQGNNLLVERPTATCRAIESSPEAPVQLATRESAEAPMWTTLNASSAQQYVISSKILWKANMNPSTTSRQSIWKPWLSYI